jgi:hypothetical protein
MQCHEFDERLHALLDYRQAPERDGRLQAHARECGGCREVLLVQESLFRSLDRNHAPLPPDGFSSRVLQRVELPLTTVRGEAVPRRWLVACAVLSTAAMALVALTLAAAGILTEPGGPAATGPQQRSGDSALEPRGGLVTDDAPALDPGTELHSESSDGKVQAVAGGAIARDDVQSIEQYGQVLQSLASRVPQAVERLDEVEEATPGLRPVRTSFTLAIGTIRRTIPPRPKRAPARPAKRDSGLISSVTPLPV